MSARTARLNPLLARFNPQADQARAIAWAALLTLLVAGPWLQGGYLFGTDWPGPRRFDWPGTVSSSLPLQAVLAGASRIVSGEATGKLFVLAILFAAALTAYRAVPAEGFAPRAAGAVLFVLNPFVFGRLHYGQLYLLAGYALLPWVAIRLRDMSLRPRWSAGALFALSMSLLAVFTTHLFLAASILALVVLLTHAIAGRNEPTYPRRLATAVLVAAATTVVFCSYWAVPFVRGEGSEAAVIAGTGAGLITAFAAVPDQSLGLVPNLLGLFGFWAESTGRFTSMKAFVPGWPVILLALLLVSGVGVVAAFRRRQERLAAWVTALVIAAVVGLLLEMGVSHPLTSGLVRWLDATLPIYRGMRDAGKWAALLSLVYSQLFGLGVAAILDWIRTLKLPASRVEWLGATAVGLLLVLPLYYGNGLLYGMHGEIKPSPYPAGWYAADWTLSSDPHPGRTLFLPWHEYMSLSFVQNQNNVVASPSPSFFSVPILSSADPEVTGIAPPSDPDRRAISDLVSAGAQGPWAEVLRTHGVKYILLAREVDWKSYQFLDSQPNLVRVGDYGSIVLYRNSLEH